MAPMMRTLLAALIFVVGSTINVAAIGSTTVTVIELGAGGSVHRTSNSAETSTSDAEGILSFWSSLHTNDGKRRNLQKGLSMVPDMFTKARSGIVINLGSSSTNVVDKVGKRVGDFSLMGAQGHSLVNKVASGYDIIKEASDLNMVEVSENALTALDIKIPEKEAKKFVSELTSFLEKIHSQSVEQGSTVVVHFISEDVTATARRLEENADDAGDDANYNNKNQDFYGYYNDYGEWVTNYKTIFQIQYFNVVLWTSVGLFMTAFVANYLVVNMPLMEDTLLFGETAKMSGA